MRWLLIALVVAASGCKPQLLPGTNIEDTAENRAVVEFLTRYRTAIVEKSTDGVLALTAKDYYEDNGTQSPTDDYGIDQLRARLQDDFQQTKEIDLEIIPQKVEREKQVVKVSYRFKQRALVGLPAGDKWLTQTDVNRLILRSEAGADMTDPGSFLIVSGL